MKQLRDKIATELWIAIQKHSITFEWKMNWFLHRKIEDLWTMLDKCEELISKEKELWQN